VGAAADKSLGVVEYSSAACQDIDWEDTTLLGQVGRNYYRRAALGIEGRRSLGVMLGYKAVLVLPSIFILTGRGGIS
jgi:hypothetical protein